MKKYLNYLISGFLSGAAISLGGFVFLFCKFNYSEIGHLIGSFLFPFGLYVICILNMHLYTGKIGYIIDQKKETIIDYIVMLIIVLISNLLSTFLFGILLYYTSSEEFINFVYNIVNNKNNDLFVLFIKSVICGALVLLAIYLFNFYDNYFSKFISIFLPIGFFVLIGLDHCIANFFYMSASFNFNLNNFYGLTISIIGNSIGSIMIYGLIKYLKKQE